MTQNPQTFYLEVEVEKTLEELETLREAIIATIPHDLIYTRDGNLNKDTRWGAILYSQNLFTSSLRSLGF